MALMPETIKNVLVAGGNISIDVGGYFPQTLVEIAANAAKLGRTVELRGCDKLFPTTMVDVARAGNGRVTFVF